MGSPITLSGFNKIDFSLILNAIMEQEQRPLRTLEAQKTALTKQAEHFRTLASKLATLESAAEALDDADSFGGRTGTSTDTTAVTVSTTNTSPPGTYDIVVSELARAQVTGSNSPHTDKDTTIVATGGTITIGGVAVAITGSVTLQGLADAINATDDIGVTATLTSPTNGTYQLVLTGKESGTSNAFTIANALTGGAAPVTFIDTDNDGVSGDTAADNATNATNASATINGITVVSASNTLTDAIAGTTLTLLTKDSTKTITVSIAQDLAATKTALKTFVTAYNDFRKFAVDQDAAAARRDASSIGRDPLLRGLRDTLRTKINDKYTASSTYQYLPEIGLEFQQTGELKLDETKFDAATVADLAEVKKLFYGSGATLGAFNSIRDAIEEYTDAGGLLPDNLLRVDEQVKTLGTRISDLGARLATRRASLQKEFIAADMAMTRLNAQMQSLSSVGGGYRLF